MIVNIYKNSKSYSPEVYAYKKYLEDNEFKVNIVHSNNDFINNDIDLKFMGFEPFFSKPKNSKITIHEYNSMSVPPYAKTKNFLKKFLNGRPDGRIFLNNSIKYRFRFSDNVKHIFRDMGVDKAFFNVKKLKTKKKYDLVYSGSINARSGLVNCLSRLADIGLKILVVGNIENKIFKSLKDKKNNLIFTGQIERTKLPELYSQCICGLNFTPDIYPFNFQTSTKTLEYCAAGIGVVSSKYYWSESFAFSNFGQFLWLENLNSKKDFYEFNYIVPNVNDYEWNNIFQKINFADFLKKYAIK